MGQQKVLWIVFSVTLFLLVVVVAGFIWFLPSDTKPGDEPRMAESADEAAKTLDPIVWVRDGGEIPGITEEEPADEADGSTTSGDVLLVYGEAGDSNGETTGETLSDKEEESASSSSITVVPTVETAPLAAVSARSTESSAAPAITPTSPPQAAVKVSAPVSAAPRTVTITQYWIQAGSFQSQSRAERTQGLLAEKGWDTRIVSRDVSGDTYFRVRLGPFENEPEAKKFLSWIKDIDSFESSYISEVYSSRMLN